MDADRFDTLSRALYVAGSRRAALAAMLSGAVGLLAASDTLAKKGKGKKKKGNKRGIPSSPPPTSPPPVGEMSIPPPPPFCASQDDEIFCDGGKCLQGACNATPTCDPRGADCDGFGSNPRCCSGFCLAGTCEGSSPVNRCHTPADCPFGIACIGYRCFSGVCQANADSCVVDASTCGDGGKCFKPHNGGPARCGISVGGCGCDSDAQCRAIHPQGFCVDITGNASFCGVGGPLTFCAAPR